MAPPARAERRDPRVTLARADLASAELRGMVDAARFAEPEPFVVSVPVAPMMARPEAGGPMDSQLLFGERVEVLEHDAHWAWGRSVADGYVGYIPAPCLEPAVAAPEPTHVVRLCLAHVYPSAAFKATPLGWLSAGSRVAVVARDESSGFAELATGGFMPEAHLAPLAPLAPAAPVAAAGLQWVAEAERYLGVPYLWGGRSGMGVDCSGLVQLALQVAGHDCPRDSDMQEAALGRDVTADEPTRRGDLVFWKGHVGIMLSATQMLHANIHHMAVAREPLGRAVARIEAGGGGPVTSHRRLDHGPARG